MLLARKILLVLAAALCTRELTQPLTTQTAAARFEFRSISSGQDHTCALDMAGRAYCWGSNSHGQLGMGSKDDEPHPNPVAVGGGHIFRQISAGFQHTCGVERDGKSYCWGSNEYGQLGTGTRIGSPAPAAVNGGLPFQYISAGATHTCGLDVSGTAYCWGGNWHGQIGAANFDGDRDTSCCMKSPIAVKSMLRFSTISTGGISTCALTTEQRAYCWGNGNDGRLGIHSGDLKDRTEPVAVATGTHLIAISTRGHHACAVTADGTVFCWGQATEGQLGSVSEVALRDAPVVAIAGKLFKSISVGMDHTCAIDVRNHLSCWGSSRFGAVTGHKDNAPVAPTQLFGSTEFLSVSSGGNDFSGHTCAITSKNEARCWGDNRKGQLGPFASDPRS